MTETAEFANTSREDLRGEKLPSRLWQSKLTRQIERAAKNAGVEIKKPTKEAKSAKRSVDLYQSKVDRLDTRLESLKDAREQREDTIEYWNDPDLLINQSPITSWISGARIHWLRARNWWTEGRMDRVQTALSKRSTKLETHQRSFEVHEDRRVRNSEKLKDIIDQHTIPAKDRLDDSSARLTGITTSINSHLDVKNNAERKLAELRKLRSRIKDTAQLHKLDQQRDEAMLAMRNAEVSLRNLSRRLKRAESHRARCMENLTLAQGARRNVEALHHLNTVERPNADSGLDSPDSISSTGPELLDMDHLREHFHPSMTSENVRMAWNDHYSHVRLAIISRERFEQMLNLDGNNYNNEVTPDDWKERLNNLYNDNEEFRDIVDEVSLSGDSPEETINFFIDFVAPSRMD